MRPSNLFRAIMFALVSLFALQGLAACETTEGFGRDMQNLGEDIEDEAQDN